jgi:hypothetical protein
MDGRGADRADTGGSGLADTWSLGGLLSPAGVEAAGVWSSGRGLSPARGTREATSSPLLWNGYRREKTAGERGERIYIFFNSLWVSVDLEQPQCGNRAVHSD